MRLSRKSEKDWLWWSVVAVLLAGLVPGMARASHSYQQAVAYCRAEMAKNPSLSCRVARGAMRCPGKYRIAKVFRHGAVLVKVCVHGRRNDSMQQARRYCRRVQQKRRIRCTAMRRRDRQCPFGMTRLRVFPGNVITCLKKSPSDKYKRQAILWCKKTFMQPGSKINCKVVRNTGRCPHDYTKVKRFGPTLFGWTACIRLDTGAQPRRLHQLCDRIKRRAGKRCLVVRRRMACPSGFITGPATREWKTCVKR